MNTVAEGITRFGSHIWVPPPIAIAKIASHPESESESISEWPDLGIGVGLRADVGIAANFVIGLCHSARGVGIGDSVCYKLHSLHCVLDRIRNLGYTASLLDPHRSSNNADVDWHWGVLVFYFLPQVWFGFTLLRILFESESAFNLQ
ncbi:hypothetical protein BDN72DRAFT_430582 [Pluteus cervinus]|uniref:Uncharacterized protein n=1 Tax=Pluteus cervinus TaxID=181527 RepID=A0ACD3A7U9_9AGAR|nr:hypothetical protein BDN72DRAFT_430582 [Pluteus cervinus]